MSVRVKENSRNFKKVYFTPPWGGAEPLDVLTDSTAYNAVTKAHKERAKGILL